MIKEEIRLPWKQDGNHDTKPERCLYGSKNAFMGARMPLWEQECLYGSKMIAMNAAGKSSLYEQDSRMKKARKLPVW